MPPSAAAVAAIRDGSAATSASCMAIGAPDASRSRALSPWWSGCTWVTTMPVTASGLVPASFSPRVRSCQVRSSSQPGSTTISALSPCSR